MHHGKQTPFSVRKEILSHRLHLINVLFHLQEYGGTSGSCDVLYREQRERMETIYKDWLIDSAKYKDNAENDTKSYKKTSRENMSPPINSFNALDID